jgi:hypothetical protein
MGAVRQFQRPDAVTLHAAVTGSWTPSTDPSRPLPGAPTARC